MLVGKNIRLRALEPFDLESLYKWENDSSVWLVSGTLAPFSRFVLEQYLASSHFDIYTNKQLRLVIDVIGNGDFKSIGCIDLFDFDPKNRRAGIGILIGEMLERKKGYASEALELLINYAFDVFDLHQLYAHVTIDNESSICLFKKHNFEITGVKQDWIFARGRWLDEYTFQYIRNRYS